MIGYLASALATRGRVVRVAGQVPSPRPAECVVVFRTGGPMSTMVTDRPQITVDSRAQRASVAAGLANLVRALMADMDGRTVGGVYVYGVAEASGPANLPDPTTPGEYRYRQTFSVALGATITD